MEINELFKRYTPDPVLVIIDVKMQSAGLPTDAYVSVDEIHDDGTTTARTFAHISSSIEAEEAEEIGVEHLLRDIKDLAVGTLSTRVSQQLTSLKGLTTQLKDIEAYLEKVVTGALPINHPILYNLQKIFNLLPNMQMANIAKSFTVSTNDEFLVVYVASLVRSVIALHDLINNKITNREVEFGKETPKEEITAK